MIRPILISFIFALSSFFCQAQFGRIGMLEFAAGGRVGLGTGITGQYFYTDNHVIEAIVYTRWQGFSTTLMYQHHMQLFDVYGLKWYLGAGGHMSFYPVGNNRPDTQKNNLAGNTYFPGVDGIIGLEYFFRSAPLQISVDVKPEYNFGPINRLDTTNGAISLRYRF